ncbi:MAG: hypothetical protein PHI58_01065 [Candidatus Omnitrophica bacterium]|nr:hypothetical protein [Candidatus Omnitrophota bacterium]
MIKKILIAVVVLIALTAASVFIYRYQILQYTAETLIRKYLPDYIRIDTIKFDFAKGDVALAGFKILNPPQFSKEYLMEIEKITCRYKLRGKKITDGIEIASPVLTNAVLDIERLGDGRINLAEAQEMMIKKAPDAGTVSRDKTEPKPSQPAGKGLAAVVTLPQKFIIKNAKAVFVDRLVRSTPTVITFENVNTELTLKMNEYYTKVLSVGSVGEGYVNGDPTQTVNWSISLDPTTPRLTMSSRFDVSGVLIPPLEPYYDKYSPFIFKTGRFSGLLIFDFDNGMIGSSDELRLSGLRFSVKQGFENAQFWQTTVPDLVKYFTSPYGEIVFDFKIKGDMAEPQFFLGPKSKEAILAMAVDKISEAIQKANSGGAGGPKSDIDKAKDYIDMFKGFIKK